MPVIDIDFQPRNGRRLNVVLGAVLFALVLHAGWRVGALQRELEEITSRQSAARPAPRTRTMPAAEAARLDQQYQTARAIISDLQIPWNGLFAGIEQASSGYSDAELLSVQPDPRKGSVGLSGEARDFPAMLAFMSRLESAGTLRGVHLVSHGIRPDGPRAYAFKLSARWETAP